MSATTKPIEMQKNVINNSTRLRIMLDMQSSMNSMVNPQWITAGYAWHRATYVEAVELLEHLGNWKWWKKQATPNIAEAQTELVDIFHFFLSASMVAARSDTNLQAIADEISKSLEETKHGAVDLSYRTVHKLLDKLISDAGSEVFDYLVFFELMKSLDMNFDDLARRYIGKCLLNRLRSKEGYATGEYIKHWNGLEDNEVLNEIMNNAPVDCDFSEFVSRELQRIYDTVKT